MDTLKAIQVFVEIHQQGSLTKAAEKLMLSRAMVSRYLEFLENRFGARLMQRNTRRVSLTQAGEEALGYCLTILEQEKKLQQLNADAQIQGVLRISAGHFMARAYLLDAIVAFQKTAPYVAFDVLSQEQMVDLIANHVDVAVRVSAHETDGYETLVLGQVEPWLVATPTYLQQAHPLNHPEQLLLHSCLVHSYLSQKVWPLTQKGGQVREYKLNKVFQSNDVYVLLEMALRHKGIGMLPMDLVAADVATGRLVRVLADYDLPTYQVMAVFVSQNHIPLMLKKFLDFLPLFFTQQQKAIQQRAHNMA
ncbi:MULTISPECIES: LysR family transcriptional regulator [Vitreoscilla]|uniref:LysR family transcriptional regulator n=1 Tax=Vitreoscilla stercoraria TaxID=61 RepID=A0ABY4E8L6_VITST|nr:MULTISPECIES: LysR family transcriptional regulator [Vitreoscilla]AUZ04707.1 LysR family transcriptional regulator [Vitreoscilla sp. C1]UOO91609.1 LysR family transcriptional regulator [Vitreoscilla stercoraria]